MFAVAAAMMPEDEPAPPPPPRRRVAYVPSELAPTVDAAKVEFCVRCGDACEEEMLFQCQDCKLRIYCSSECRQDDCGAHKKADGQCQQLAQLRHAVSQAVRDLRSPSVAAARTAWYQRRFPVNEHHGGGRADGYFHQLMVGQYAADPYAKVPLECRTQLAHAMVRHTSSAWAVERGLKFLLQLKRDTYLVDENSRMDASIATALLKLYREDDVVSFILYWLDWRNSRGPNDGDMENLRDHVIGNWETASKVWPFPVAKDARLGHDLVERFCKFDAQQAGVLVPMEFALAVLVIHLRFVTLYRKRAEAATVFFKHAPCDLPRDVKLHVLSFLVEGGFERFQKQSQHAKDMMDYIDQRDAVLLPALIHPRLANNNNNNAVGGEASTATVCFETFLQDFANGEPVIRTIRSMILDCYNEGDGWS